MVIGRLHQTVRGYPDILTGTFMVRQLQPWFENVGKRQVKSPKYGASWEGFVIEQVHRITAPAELYFWGTHQGAELDLLFFDRGKRFGIEIKANEAPKITAAMRRVLDELDLAYLWVVYPWRRSYPVDNRIGVLSIGELERLPEEIAKITS